MNKLQLTTEALELALADAPNTPTAWVPLRRATVEEALRVLGGVETAVAALRTLEREIEDDRPSTNGTLTPQATTAIVANGNGHVTLEPAQRITYTQPAHSNGKTQPARDKETNTWRRKPKAERLAIVQATIRQLSVNSPDGWVSQAQFDKGRPNDMPTAGAHVAAFKLAWNDLVKAALEQKEPAASAADPFRG